MVNKEIKYIGFYDISSEEQMRVSSVPAINKMDYISDSIIKAGYQVHIISPSWFDASAKNLQFKASTTTLLNANKKVTFSPSFGTSIKSLGYLKITISLVWLFFWLLFNTKKNERILVYHAQWFSIPIIMAKKIKRFQLILEVEEIYGEVWKTKKILYKWEHKLIKNADYYVAVSDVLAKILGNKVKTVIYGNYATPNYNKSSIKSKGINIVYAGSIDCTKGGAYNTVECALLLPQKYNIHICGFGSEADITKLNEMISRVNEKLNREAVIYHGAIPDELFSEFLHSCDIAINPQKDGENMTTLFPSKIIKYLSHNLRVVSTRIKSINESKISNLIYFSESDSPKSIVEAILQLDLKTKYNSVAVIKKLNTNFVKDLSEMFHTD